MNKKVKLDKYAETEPCRIHALSHDGRGITTLNKKKIFVTGALPGELVTARLTRSKKQYADGIVMSMLEPSATRVAPPCHHADICGGCSLQHMDDAAQILFKQQTLLDQLNHFGKVAPQTILPPIQADSLGYRRKARLGVRYVIKKEQVLVGFREKSSRYLAEIENCEVLHPRVGHQLTLLKSLVASLDAFDHIPQIEMAMGDEEIALIFRHMVDLSHEDRCKLKVFGETHEFSIFLQPNPPALLEKLTPENDTNILTYSLPDHHLTFQFEPLDFTQVNLAVNRLMVNQALELLALTPDDEVLDLFCGIGNFSLPMAKYAKHVTGIEGCSKMTTRAYTNAERNHLQNLSFYAADLMAEKLTAPWLGMNYDKILLDPPRAGAKEILPYIGKMNPKKIVYVSCNPATLARDAGHLVHHEGYQLSKLGTINMFPHTAHIEAIALFEKLK